MSSDPFDQQISLIIHVPGFSCFRDKALASDLTRQTACEVMKL